MNKIALVLMILSCIRVQGQDSQVDYVVTSRLDTLRGAAAIYTYDIVDRIQIAEKTGKKSFTALQVREVSIQNEIYHPVKSDDRIVMMKLVTPGFLSLYMAHQPKNSLYQTPYLVKRGGESLEVPNLSFKKLVSAFLGECKAIQDKVKNTEYTRKDLDKIIEEFNACTSNPQPAPQPVVAETLPDNELAPLTDLISKLEKDESLPTKKDALDILKDITDKVKHKQAVPNYLLEGLKTQLKDAPAYQQDLEKVLEVVKHQ